MDSLKTLVTSPTRGLGYCCLWFFFRRYKRTSLIANRLGLHRATVARYKARWREGEFSCEECSRCLKRRVRSL